MAFCCCRVSSVGSEEERQGRRVNREIERQLKQWKDEMYRRANVLLLGQDEVGKRLFMELSRREYGEEYSEDERRTKFRALVYLNIYMAVHYLAKEMELRGISYNDDGNREFAIYVAQTISVDSTPYHMPQGITEEEKMSIQKFWQDVRVQECYTIVHQEMHMKFFNHVYFFNHLDRICEANYVPSMEDVQHVQFGPGNPPIEFTVNLQAVTALKFRVFTAPNLLMRSRLLKIRLLNEADTMIYIIDISEYNEYNEYMYEDNKLQERIQAVELLANSRWFNSIAIIIVLTNVDLFRVKLKSSPLHVHFPAYQGPVGDSEAALQFISDLFMRICPDSEDKPLVHFMNNNDDADCIKSVFRDVQHVILKKSDFQTGSNT